MEAQYYHGLTELGIGEHDKIKKRLDEERRCEYEDYRAHKETQTEKSTRHKWERVSDDAPTIQGNSCQDSCGDGAETLEERRQKQKDYGDELRGQIAEKNRNTAQTVKEDIEYDEEDRELAHEFPNTFSYGTQNQNNTSVQ